MYRSSHHSPRDNRWESAGGGDTDNNIAIIIFSFFLFFFSNSGIRLDCALSLKVRGQGGGGLSSLGRFSGYKLAVGTECIVCRILSGSAGRAGGQPVGVISGLSCGDTLGHVECFIPFSASKGHEYIIKLSRHQEQKEIP